MSKKEYILVTGGAGYIGSHAVKLLINKGYNVLVLDNLSTGHVKAVDEKAELIIGDIQNLDLLYNVFKSYKIKGVIHFAGKIAVNESVKYPLSYFNENITLISNILRMMRVFNVRNIVFSSTAAVYGTSDKEQITEDAPLHPESPYGFSKLTAENLIRYAEKAYGIKHIIFRYFNVAGSYDSYEIGEAHPVETHLIPCIVDSIIKNSQVTIFGNDYPTNDGTCVRDYIHIMDLVEAHVQGMEYLLNQPENECESQTINLGSNNGYSNLEIVNAVSDVTKKQVNFVFGDRREGDPAKIIASNKKAFEILSWTPKHSLEDIIFSTYVFRTSHPRLYEDQDDVTFNDLDKAKIVKVKVRGKNKNYLHYLEDIEVEDRKRFSKIKKSNFKLLSNKFISD